MVILYIAFKHDPRDPDAASGSDFNFHQALVRQGFEVEVVGPFNRGPNLLERGVSRLYRAATKMRFVKFHFSQCLHSSRAADREIKALRPDAVFTIFPAAVAFLKVRVPLVVRLDTTFLGQQEFWPIYGQLALQMSVWQERRSFHRSSCIITQSDWSKKILESRYGVAPKKVAVFTSPAALPASIIPPMIEVQAAKRLESPIQLLFVGREVERKGLSIALELIEELKTLGIAARLTVCGLEGSSTDKIRYVGILHKAVADELHDYINLYRNAHFLVHPARFEAAGIVPSEAAAFATPTITNDTGGLATTVKDGISGVVLPMNSPARDYAVAIASLVRNPQRYYRLCETTRQRYEAELNWDVAGRRFATILWETLEASNATNL